MTRKSTMNYLLTYIIYNIYSLYSGKQGKHFKNSVKYFNGSLYSLKKTSFTLGPMTS